jgi:transposase
MSKRRYRSVKCQQFDWQKLAESVSGKPVILAIDVAKEEFMAALLLDQEVIAKVKWRHPAETPHWLAGIEKVAQAGNLEAVMEPSGTYGDAIRWQLSQRGIEVHLVNPKRVHDAAEVYDGVPSLHDAKATEIIGYLHLQGRSRPWRELAPEQRAADSLLNRLRICKQQQQANLGRLEALLSRHWPESLSLLQLKSRTLHQVLASFGGPGQIAACAEQAQALMQRVGRPGLSHEKVEKLLDSAVHTLGVPTLCEEDEGLQWLAQRLLETDEQIRQLEGKIAQRVKHHDVLEPMAQVVGKVTSIVLLAAQGDPRGYPDAASYCKGMGLNLKEHSSGKQKGRLTITKRGPSITRCYLYFTALRLIAQDPLVKRWYEAKTKRPGSIKMKVVIELMRKLAKGLWHCAQGETFRTDKLFNLKAVELV